MSVQIPNRLLAAATILDLSYSGQSGFVGNVGDSIETGAPNRCELIYAPDTEVVPERLVFRITPHAIEARYNVVSLGPQSFVLDWFGSEAPRSFDFDLLIWQLPNDAVNP